MRFMFAFASVIFAFMSFAAQADMIRVRDVESAHAPTIIRGAPVRCHGSQPLIIKVGSYVQHAQSAKRNCGRHVPIAAKVTQVTNVFIIARRHERVYIKFN